MNLRNEIAEVIGIKLPNSISNGEYKVFESTQEDGYTRQLIEFDSYGDKVRAFLLLPESGLMRVVKIQFVNVLAWTIIVISLLDNNLTK